MRQLAGIVICGLLAVPNCCRADLLITLKEVGENRVRISWEGSGVIDASFPLGTFDDLDFNDFLGISPFKDSIGGGPQGNGHTYSLSVPLTLTIRPDTAAETTQSYGEIRLMRDTTPGLPGIDNSDLTLVGQHPILPQGEQYRASGSALVELEQDVPNAANLEFSTHLRVGTYFPNNAITDADVFGAVTLQVIAVPETSAITCLTAVCFAVSFFRK